METCVMETCPLIDDPGPKMERCAGVRWSDGCPRYDGERRRAKGRVCEGCEDECVLNGV